MSALEYEEKSSPKPEVDRFNKRSPIYQLSLDDISSEQIDEIRALEEGWFVEFKSIFIDTAKIAKSISSFANAYGGVLIIGVQETSKGRKFDHFVPLSKDEAEETILRLRQAVESHLSPCPFFESKLIEIPGSELSNSIGGWIVFVKIPKGEKAPYLHSSGAIYTRKGDSSSPVALTELSLLEKLWSDRAKRAGEIERRIAFLREQSVSDCPRLDIFIAKVDGVRGGSAPIGLKTFSDIARQPVFPKSPSLFDNIYTIDSSFVARRTEGAIDSFGIIWDYDWYRHLHHIQIPLACHEWNEYELNSDRCGNERIAGLENYLVSREEFKGKRIFIVDLTVSMYIMSAIFYMVSKLHLGGGGKEKFTINIKASSVKRTVVYLDLPRYQDHLRESGLPFVHRDIDFLSSSMNPDDWLEFKILDSDEEFVKGGNLDGDNTFLNFVDIAQSLGVSRYVSLGQHDDADGGAAVEDLINAFNKLISSSFSYSCQSNIAK